MEVYLGKNIHKQRREVEREKQKTVDRYDVCFDAFEFMCENDEAWPLAVGRWL